MFSPLRIATLAAVLMSGVAQAAEPLSIDVHRDANCGCCKDWIKHLESNGFKVNDQVETNMSAVKQSLGVPAGLASCHTGVIGGKFVEGHVPAAQIIQLNQRTDLVGMAVPGMPAGSPGMDQGQARQAYQVIGLSTTGNETVVAEYAAE